MVLLLLAAGFSLGLLVVLPPLPVSTCCMCKDFFDFLCLPSTHCIPLDFAHLCQSMGPGFIFSIYKLQFLFRWGASKVFLGVKVEILSQPASPPRKSGHQKKEKKFVVVYFAF